MAEIDRQRPFPITSAQLTGNFCETLFYGMYLVTCTFCARTLFLTGHGKEERFRRLGEIRWLMTSVAFSLLFLCTFDVAIGLLHNFHAFIYAKDAEIEFFNIADWINIARSANVFVGAIIGDFVLIYRCWIVYGCRFRVAVPSFVLYLGSIATTIRLMEIEGNPNTPSNISLNSPQIRPWFDAFFAITTAQNVLTTSLIIWRIWRVEKQCERFNMTESGLSNSRPQHLRKVIRVIAESGAAYTLTVVLTLIVSSVQNNAEYPVSNMTLGMAFNVILIRSTAQRDQQFTTFDQNERTTIWGTSMRFVPGQTATQDVEPA
ncbi:hypothetical protein NP233_g8137 [Leucocoprinus birnbaumii]|uniref:Uncharacterized protein n=1 Tax=Leucocoprinus birnbaumii TaxID=56174 RepID=A0AAD5YU41_9AGAR|nr:hypothetical protein NP233_g8137 [Leucocoprinus birnbaumii]